MANAFSKDNSGGNKAGVVLRQHRLNEAEKTKTAFLMGYSETAFVADSELADFKLEYFTPAGRSLCAVTPQSGLLLCCGTWGCLKTGVYH